MLWLFYPLDRSKTVDVYVVDVGSGDDAREVYVMADSEHEAETQVASRTGEVVRYAEFFSNDPDDADEGI